MILVQIAWDDTRGGKVELVFLVDTSGSMYSEWADVCTVIYGGNFAAGGYFQGFKPMLQEGNMTVYETIYGLGNTLPGAQLAVETAQHTTRTLALAQRLLELLMAMTLAVSENSLVPFTTETHTLGTQERTGAPEPTGPVFHGRMHKETFLEILQHKTTTSGTPTQQRLQFLSLTKVQKTETQHNKPTIRLQLKRHTTTVSTPVSFQ
jgi:hypothetical protein